MEKVGLAQAGLSAAPAAPCEWCWGLFCRSLPYPGGASKPPGPSHGFDEGIDLGSSWDWRELQNP